MSFINIVTGIIAGIAAFPVLLFALLEFGAFVITPIFPNDGRDHHFLIPYVGLAATPLAILLYTRLKKVGRSGSFINTFIKTFANLGLVFFILHNFLTFVYGNVNNDAWSNSLMIDVVAPPEYFAERKLVPDLFQLNADPKQWALKEIIDGPHLDIQGIHDSKCQNRTFARFMFHEILPQSRVAAILKKGVMFAGVWSMHSYTDGPKQTQPKVYTDHAYGNDTPFNLVLIKPLLIDSFNLFSEFTKMDIDGDHWHIQAPGPEPYQSVPLDVKAEFTDKVVKDAKFVMDQYSCMNEGAWLEKLIGKRFCFRKFMQASKSIEVEGTFSHPLFGTQNQAFPMGSVDQCEQPYIRAVLTKGLHWTRDTYLC